MPSTDDIALVSTVEQRDDADDADAERDADIDERIESAVALQVDDDTVGGAAHVGSDARATTR